MAKYIDADKMLVDESEAYLFAQSKITDKVTRDINFVVHTKLQNLLADAPAADVVEVLTDDDVLRWCEQRNCSIITNEYLHYLLDEAPFVATNLQLTCNNLQPKDSADMRDEVEE